LIRVFISVTHRVAISNRRLVALDAHGVTFRYKDYRRNGQERYRTMTLAPNEFIRRFLLHVLPKAREHARPWAADVARSPRRTFPGGKRPPRWHLASKE
jgi:hypothetical protein